MPELDSGGAERAAIDISEALAGAGARALVATEGGRLISELQAKGGIAIRFPAATKNPLAMAANVSRLTHILRAERVDLVHARSRAPAWVALAATRRARVPMVTTFHGIYSGRSPIKLNYNSVMARGAVIIANSAFTAEHIAKTLSRRRASASRSSIAASISAAFRWARSSLPRARLREAWKLRRTSRSCSCRRA